MDIWVGIFRYINLQFYNHACLDTEIAIPYPWHEVYSSKAIGKKNMDLFTNHTQNGTAKILLSQPLHIYKQSL